VSDWVGNQVLRLQSLAIFRRGGVGRSTPIPCPSGHALRDLRNSRQVINIEQIRLDACLYIYGFLRLQARRMFSSQYEKWEDPHIIALVELDLQKMRVHILLNREAMRERLRELDRPLGTVTRNMPSNPVSTN
jgi:hypothetical protein